MKKAVSIVIIICIVFFSGCSGKDEAASSNNNIQKEDGSSDFLASSEDQKTSSDKTQESQDANGQPEKSEKDDDKVGNVDTQSKNVKPQVRTTHDETETKEKSDYTKGYSLSVENQGNQYSLYITYENTGEKVLLAKSKESQVTDYHDPKYFTGTIRDIKNPTKSYDGSKVYYATDAPTPTNGYGAANDTTRVIDLKTLEDTVLCSMRIERIVGETPYETDLILAGYVPGETREGLVIHYYLADNQGDVKIDLGDSLRSNLVDQIDQAFQEKNAPKVVRRDGLLSDLGKTGEEIINQYGTPDEDGAQLGYPVFGYEDQAMYTLKNNRVNGLMIYDGSLFEITVGKNFNEVLPSNFELRAAKSDDTLIFTTRVGEGIINDYNVLCAVDDQGTIVGITALDPNVGESSLCQYTNESVHGEKIDFTNCRAVVVENYSGKNEGNLDEEDYINLSYQFKPWTYYNFAVFGTITNVKLKTKPNMEDDYSIYDLSDSISDSLVTIRSRFPTDFSLDIITFNGPDGRFYEIPVEDMSDDYSVVKIK